MDPRRCRFGVGVDGLCRTRRQAEAKFTYCKKCGRLVNEEFAVNGNCQREDCDAAAALKKGGN